MDYATTYSDAVTVSALGGIFALGAMGFVISLAVAVVTIIALWKIFTKAGEEGWKSIIPIYNIVILFKIVGLNPLLVLIYLASIIPVIGGLIALVLSVYVIIKLGQSFGKSNGFIVGLVLLSPIFMCILGFGNDTYIGKPYQDGNGTTTPPQV